MKIILLLFAIIQAPHLNHSVATEDSLLIRSLVSSNLESFPDSFECFKETICNYNIPIVPVLYEHPDVSVPLLIKKTVRIASEAQWEVDQVNFMQITLWDCLSEHCIETLSAIKLLSINKRKHFWRFMFSGIHPSCHLEQYDMIMENSYFGSQNRLISNGFCYNLASETLFAKSDFMSINKDSEERINSYVFCLKILNQQEMNEYRQMNFVQQYKYYNSIIKTLADEDVKLFLHAIKVNGELPISGITRVVLMLKHDILLHHCCPITERKDIYF